MALLLEHPSHLPYHPTPLGCYQAQYEFHDSYSKFSLTILHMIMYISLLLSPYIPAPPPSCVHKSVLNVCISIAALQVGSLVLYF